MTTMVNLTIDYSAFEQRAVQRAEHLTRLLRVFEGGEPAGTTSCLAAGVPVRGGEHVVVFARGRERQAIVVCATGTELTADYLTANALAAARGARLAGELGVDPVSYATGCASRARQAAEAKLRTWRRWVTTSPARLATDEAARLVWREIAPGHRMAGPGSVAPAAAAKLERLEAERQLRQFPRTAWPCAVYSEAFEQAYVRDRVNQICTQAPYLAWVSVHNVTVPRERARVIISGGRG